MQPNQQRLQQFAIRCLHPVDSELNSAELFVASIGRLRPGLVDLCLLADDGEEVCDVLPVLELDLFDVLLEPRERRARADFLPDPRAQPVTEGVASPATG